MERVGGQNLRQWLSEHPTPAPTAQRRLAEDLLSGLEYLEQKAVTHKDLKPDNLLVCDGQLTIIDFSLAAMAEDAPYGGTALYRDPASARWTHGTDRFAAALCLFELYAGRHAFDGHVPEPGQLPLVREGRHRTFGPCRLFSKGTRSSSREALPFRQSHAGCPARGPWRRPTTITLHAATEPARCDDPAPAHWAFAAGAKRARPLPG